MICTLRRPPRHIRGSGTDATRLIDGRALPVDSAEVTCPRFCTSDYAGPGGRVLEVVAAASASANSRGVGDDTLQLAIPVLQGLQPLGLAHLQPAVLPPPALDRRRAHADPAAQLAELGARLELSQVPDNLPFRESTLPLGSSWVEDRHNNWIRIRGLRQLRRLFTGLSGTKLGLSRYSTGRARVPMSTHKNARWTP